MSGSRFYRTNGVTYSRNVEQKEEDHAHGVVDASQESADHALGNGVDQLHGELEKDGTRRVGERTGQHGGHVQLGQTEGKDSQAQQAHPDPAHDASGHDDDQRRLHFPFQMVHDGGHDDGRHAVAHDGNQPDVADDPIDVFGVSQRQRSKGDVHDRVPGRDQTVKQRKTEGHQQSLFVPEARKGG